MVLKLAGSIPLPSSTVRLQSIDDHSRTFSGVTDAGGRFEIKGIDPGRYAAVAGKPLDASRIADLRAYGFVEIDPAGRLRVTPAGFPVLDAVVADLAA